MGCVMRSEGGCGGHTTVQINFSCELAMMSNMRMGSTGPAERMLEVAMMDACSGFFGPPVLFSLSLVSLRV